MIVNTWQIYPKHCNPVKIGDNFMCHGGTILGKADRIAAILAQNLLEGTGLRALTVGSSDVQFLRGPMCGEVVKTLAQIDSVGVSRITIQTYILDSDNNEVFRGKYAFCSFRIAGDKPVLTPHKIVLETPKGTA